MTSMKVNHFSKVLSMNMDCNVFMPDGLNDDEELKVMWLCHGGSGDENEWMYFSNALRLVDDYHIAIVMVNVNDSCYVDMAMGKKYGTYVGDELPKLIHSMFKRLSGRREDNYICGLSNGGYGCFLIGIKYREKFSAIGAFSAGDKADVIVKPHKGITPRIRMFGADNIVDTDYSMKYVAGKAAKEYMADPDNAVPLPRIYHACGEFDPWIDLNLLVKEYMTELDCKAYDYTYHEAPGCGHEWSFWEIELLNFVKYLGLEKYKE